MATCQKCGKPVEFRVVDGRAIPFHFDGGCAGARGGTAFDPVRRNAESECRKTSCPSCGASVYFIRHNGGSVWIEPPLGPPWDRHPCFDTVPNVSRGNRTASIASAELTGKLGGGGGITGVVVQTEISADRRQTAMKIAIGKREALALLVKGGADAWTGELVVVSLPQRRVYLASDPTYCFVIIGEQKVGHDRSATRSAVALNVDDPALSKKQRSLLRRYSERGFDADWKQADAACLAPLITGKDQDLAIHVAAIGILEHAERHNDISAALPLVVSLPRPKRERLIRWFHQFSPISIDLQRKQRKAYVFKTPSGERRPFRIAEARSTPI